MTQTEKTKGKKEEKERKITPSTKFFGFSFFLKITQLLPSNLTAWKVLIEGPAVWQVPLLFLASSSFLPTVYVLGPAVGSYRSGHGSHIAQLPLLCHPCFGMDGGGWAVRWAWWPCLQLSSWDSATATGDTGAGLPLHTIVHAQGQLPSPLLLSWLPASPHQDPVVHSWVAALQAPGLCGPELFNAFLWSSRASSQWPRPHVTSS